VHHSALGQNGQNEEDSAVSYKADRGHAARLAAQAQRAKTQRNRDRRRQDRQRATWPQPAKPARQRQEDDR
jgi:hypothetical protein